MLNIALFHAHQLSKHERLANLDEILEGSGNGIKTIAGTHANGIRAISTLLLEDFVDDLLLFFILLVFLLP